MNAGTTIERAFELAREGRCASVEEIRRTLSREGFGGVDAHLAGQGIRNQLKALMRQHSARAGTIPRLGDSRLPKENRHE